MRRLTWLAAAILLAVAPAGSAAADDGFVPLFTADGVPPGWHAVVYHDVSQPLPASEDWHVEKGILYSSTSRGSFLISERQYDDFVLDFEFMLGPRGNSGVGLRVGAAGDPAFDALEVQMVDARYYGDDPYGPDQLTGSLYQAVAPSKQVYKPEGWNRFEITCQGPKVTIKLNGETIQDLNLDEQTQPLKRGEPLAARPRRGRIGFQELSRGGTHAQIRNARIKELGK